MNIIKFVVNRLYCAVLSLDQLGSATLNKRWALRAENLLEF